MATINLMLQFTQIERKFNWSEVTISDVVENSVGFEISCCHEEILEDAWKIVKKQLNEILNLWKHIFEQQRLRENYVNMKTRLNFVKWGWKKILKTCNWRNFKKGKWFHHLAKIKYIFWKGTWEHSVEIKTEFKEACIKSLKKLNALLSIQTYTIEGCLIILVLCV